jgi:anti-sigma factor RsiW
MEHDEIRSLIHSYADGELDAANIRLVENHLESCRDCRGAEEGIRSLRAALTNSAPAFRAPASLRKKIRADLRRETSAGSERQSSWSWLSFALGTACAVLLLGFVFSQSYRGISRNAIADQVVADHVRSLLATHLVDVPSSDQHTVKPWFDGKVDFAPEVHDFATQGFPLVGGRLDYFDGKTVVALVYRRHQHPINLFISPAPARSDSSPEAMARRGYNLIHWTRGEMSYWAVSDLNDAELGQFASLVITGK